MKKLKHSEIKTYRDRVLSEDDECYICGSTIKDPVLDHCHVTGHVRDVICRECNALEGKIHNFCKRFLPTKDRNVAVQGVLRYWDRDYSSNPLHPKFLTPEDKEIRALKRRIRAAKRDSTKERLKSEIRIIQEGVKHRVRGEESSPVE